MTRTLLATLLFALLAACGERPVSNAVGRGKQVFAEHCATCHSTSPDLVIVGPSLSGVALRAEASGDARAYLETSILDPGAVVVDGFENLMPGDFQGRLTPQDLQAVIEFLLTLE